MSQAEDTQRCFQTTSDPPSLNYTVPKKVSALKGALKALGATVAKGMQDAGNQAAHIAQDAGDAIAKGAQDAGAGIADGGGHAAKHRHEPLPQTLGIGRRTRRLAEQPERVRRYGAYHRRLAALRSCGSAPPNRIPMNSVIRSLTFHSDGQKRSAAPLVQEEGKRTVF